MFIIKIATLLFSIFWTLSLFGQNAEAIYLTWQQDPTSTMTVQWLTKHEVAKESTKEAATPEPESQALVEPIQIEPIIDVIEYQPLDGETWKEATGYHRWLPQEEPYIVHTVELTGLKPGTSYRFRVQASEEENRFRTMPATLKEPITFVTGGDTYQVEKFFELTNQEAVKHEPLFTIFGGDLAYASPHDTKKPEDATRWLNWLRIYSRSMITPSGYKVPLLVAIGNHDVKGWYGKTTNDAPFFYTLLATPGLPGYKALQFSNYLTVILLDSNHSNPIKGKQTEWLEGALRYARDTLHKIAVYHIPGYPSVKSFRMKESVQIRRHWVPLFEHYNLSIALEHNDHAYKRTFPLIDDSPHPQGILYIGDGAWGAKPRVPQEARSTSYLATTKSEKHFIKMKLSETEREITAITPGGQVIDHYIQFID